METVNAMATAAAKAVWGDSSANTEPVSGKTGNTAAGEPYDAGNLDQTGSSTTNNNNTTSSTTGTTTGTSDAKTTGIGSGSTTAGDSTTTHHSADTTTGMTGTTSGTDNSTSASGAAKDAAFAKTTGTAATADDTPENPSTQQKLRDADASKGQQDTRDPENPLTNPKSAPTEVNEKKTNSEEGVAEDIKLDGPGPKPLEEVAREHGGDAGNIGDRKGSLVPPRDPNDTSEAPKSDDDKKEEKGDGTQYVKTSGLQADGGDFDATLPGAGREADRLMEQKGMHPNADKGDKSTSLGSDDHKHDGGETKEKKKLTQRIKEKLHSH